MKNFKKTISLILAICMIASLAISASAANTVDASGGTGTSSVTLSSTADGSIGGDPAATTPSRPFCLSLSALTAPFPPRLTPRSSTTLSVLLRSLL